MKEATGEVSMTVITLVAIAVVGGIIALMWPTIQEKIEGLWNNDAGTATECAEQGGVWKNGACDYTP
jgi:hypothetical protein